LFERDKKIFGVSPEQARARALSFVRQLLARKSVVDAQGRRVEL
jgi:hypothetical protein